VADGDQAARQHPGGTSEFDLPSYHYWMHRPVDARRADLVAWIRPIDRCTPRSRSS